MRYRPLARLALLIALFISSVSAAFAQGAASVFEGAVDQINCETIRFIHREAGRSEIANNMECLSFESIYKSIPEDEASTTGQLAKNINAVKSKFSADKDLGTQLDAAISIAVKKIESKTRKGNIPDFKKKLADIKSDAIKNAASLANGAEANNTEAGAADNNAADNNTAATTDENNENGIVIQPDGDNDTKAPVTTKGGIDWLGWLSLVTALLALALAGSNFLKKSPKKPAANVYTPAVNDGENAYRAKDESAAIEIKNMEARMQQELNRLRAEFDDKIAAFTASTGYTEPESMPEPDEPVYIQSTMGTGGVPSLSDAMVETMDLPLETAAIDEIEEHTGNVQQEEIHSPVMQQAPVASHAPEAAVTEMQNMATNLFHESDEEPATFEITSEEIEAMPEPEPSVMEGPAATTAPYAPSQPDLGMPEEEEEEGLPFYRYLGAPGAHGTFPDTDLSDAAGQNAVFEVEMYEDVPNKAFFSPLPYPEVVARVLADPAQYLAPCCSYTEDPTGKHHIIVDEEGTLRKEGDQWVVHDKAKIRFA